MAGVQKSLRLPPETTKQIEQMAKETGQDFSNVTKDLLQEAIKMRRCPGILFAEGTSGRRARVAGSGIEVWEVIAVYKSMREDFKRLQKTYHWLSGGQLKAALGYYINYPQEIDRIIEQNEQWTEEKVRDRYTFMRSSL
ncbi:MAG: hypothetical protein FJ115_18230 [Deltaproteobacteria bacterium]|nr:hypothetical protein [Deltaproteobacteria bacterium]